MKRLKTHAFDFGQYRIELEEFNVLLKNHSELSEGKDILPFFAARPHLSSQIATIFPKIVKTERLAFEFDIFGDFVADVVVGDPHSNTYCFIEFEDARKNSIFVRSGNKYKYEFAPRLEHGFSQIIDWFYKIDGLQNSDDLEERFGVNKIDFEAILIIGRDKFLTTSLKKRLDWRARMTVISSKNVYCYTFDELYAILVYRVKLFKEGL